MERERETGRVGGREGGREGERERERERGREKGRERESSPTDPSGNTVMFMLQTVDITRKKKKGKLKKALSSQTLQFQSVPADLDHKSKRPLPLSPQN